VVKEDGTMNVRRTVTKIAAVGILAGSGVAIAAGPASAMPNNCQAMHSASLRAARYMDEAGSVQAWNLAYDMWLLAENYLDSYC
jgi:hypothetical protein